MATKTNTTATEKEAEIKETTAEAVKKVKIKLPRISREGNDDCFVSVNNETFLIKRGVEVEVPEYVKEVIDNQERLQDETYKLQNKAAGN